MTSTYVPIYHLYTKPFSRYVVQSSTFRTLTHVFLSYTVYSRNCYVTRRQTVGSSYPRVKQSILFACRRAPVQRATASPFYLCVHHVRGVIRRQNVHNRSLVQPPDRLGCDKVPYTDVFLSLEQVNILNNISETVDDPYHTNVQTSTRHLGNIVIIPTSCDTNARRQLQEFPSFTACIATDSNAQLSQHETALIALKPTTRGILLALTLTVAASTRP